MVLAASWYVAGPREPRETRIQSCDIVAKDVDLEPMLARHKLYHRCGGEGHGPKYLEDLEG